MRRAFRNAVVVGSVGALLVLGACSSDSGSDEASGETTASTSATEGDGVAVAVTAVEDTATEWSLVTDPGAVPAGEVSFTFENTGAVEHEMVVLKTDTDPADLEVVDGRVSEDDSIGEIAETPVGETDTATFNMEAGDYVLVCNVDGHYEAGMHTAFTVE